MKKSITSPNEPETSHILGIDFGTAKIGLALADNETKLAFAHITLKNGRNFFNDLAEIIEKKNVKTAVIGCLEHNINRKNGESKNQFVSDLEKKIKSKFPDIRVAYQEEMFTSIIARKNLAEKGAKNLNLDDQESARIILQEWLDNNFCATI